MAKTFEELIESSPPSLALYNLFERTPASVLRRLGLRAALRGHLKFGLAGSACGFKGRFQASECSLTRRLLLKSRLNSPSTPRYSPRLTRRPLHHIHIAMMHMPVPTYREALSARTPSPNTSTPKSTAPNLKSSTTCQPCLPSLTATAPSTTSCGRPRNHKGHRVLNAERYI